ncbi:FAD-dependent oxidoreductase [Micromonospora sp. NPDC005174]|uniref:FAD-dependent oxidoreductase n=1 Tax=unclassified Micromonospora TaxID=2617518 RepID=UPI0033B798C1
MSTGDADGPVLDAEQFDRLASYGTEEEVRQGQHLYAAGDSSYDFFLLRTATAEAVRNATSLEPERLIYRRGPGEFLGELSLLTGQQVFLTVRVVTAGTVVRITAPDLRRVLADQVDIADVLIETFRARRELMRGAAGNALEIVGRPNVAGSLELRTYVNQMLLPHAWLDASSLPGRALMRAEGVGEDELPVAVTSNRVLRHATPGTVAEALGLTYVPTARDPDLVVVGAGPAGLAAAVYGASEGLVTVLLDGTGIGGQAAKSARIENYLGFPEGVSGEQLARLAMLQALKFGVQIYAPCAVVGLDVSDESRPVVELEDGTRIATSAVIAATGARYRRLDIERWAEFEQSGCVRYAATELDLRGYESQPVAVLGGANSAGQAALSLAARGCSVHLVVRSTDLGAKMSAYLTDRIQANPRITIHTGSTLRELQGEDSLAAIVVEKEGEPTRLDCRGLFCFIGAEPESAWMKGIAMDESGFVLTDSRLPSDTHQSPLPFQTSATRVFAVGDIRSGSTKRVATAVGEGAGAVSAVHTVRAR